MSHSRYPMFDNEAYYKLYQAALNSGQFSGGFDEFIDWTYEQGYHHSGSDGLSGRIYDFLQSIGLNSGVLSSLISKWSGSSLTGAQREEMEWNEQQAAITRQREDTQYQRTVADMKAAGVNPALAMTNGASVSPSSAQAQGNVNSGSNGMSMSDLIQLIRLPMEMRQMSRMTDADIAMKNAQTGLTVAETGKVKREAEGIANQNEWFVDTRNYERDYLQLRNDGAAKANALTDAQIDNARATLPVIQEQLNNLQQDTGVKIMEQLYKSASIEQITRLMPYQMALLSAQTEQAKAAAALAIIQEAYQQKLIEDGYIDQLCEQMRQQAIASGAAADQAEINTAIAEFRHALRTGHAFDSMPKWIRWLPNSVVAGVFNAVEIAGPVVGPFLGFAAAGRALRARTPSAPQYQSVPGVSDGTTYGIPGY